MDFSEYFVEIEDRNILIKYPKNTNSEAFEISGFSDFDYSLTTLPTLFRNFANLFEIFDNILSNILNENGKEFYISFTKKITDLDGIIRIVFSYNFINKVYSDEKERAFIAYARESITPWATMIASDIDDDDDDDDDEYDDFFN